MKKRGQIEISFQLIFSLILVAVFIYAAVTGIKYFMNTADHAKIVSFISEVEARVESAWMTTEISQNYEFNLPAGIKYVCFAKPNTLDIISLSRLNISECGDFNTYVSNFKSAGMNMFFCPAKASWTVGAPIDATIDCKGKDCLEFPKSPYCIKNNGKISIKLEKNYGEAKIILS